MDAGKSPYYDRAAQWLAHARRAYRSSGREQEFLGYLTELLAHHARKYRLVPLLKALKSA